MNRYYWDISNREVSNLIERAEHGCGKSQLGKCLPETVVESKAINRHLNHEAGSMSVSLATTLKELSQSDYSFKDPEVYVREEKQWRGEDYVSLEDDFRKYLLLPYSNSDLSEVTGKTVAASENYRFGEDKSIPRDSYLQAFYMTKEIIEDGLDCRGDIFKKIPSGRERLYEASEDEILIFEMIERLSDDPTGFDKFFSILERSKEILEDPLKDSYIGFDRSIRSRQVSSLTDFNLLEKYCKGTYEIKMDERLLEVAISEMEKIQD